MADETRTSLLPTVQSNTQNNQGNECHICRRSSRTNRGLFQHMNTCRQINTRNLSAITCSLKTTFIANCYMKPARLFVVGNHELKSKEVTTQGDPIAVGAYTPGVTPLIHFLNEFIFTNKHKSKEVAFADDFTVAAKASKIKAY